LPGTNPAPIPAQSLDFLAGMRTMTTAGDAPGQTGMAAHVYVATADMVDDHFFNADGELLVVPQEGAVRFVTEMGVIEIAPGEICVLPRGLVFRVELIDGPVRGYVCENYGAKFTMPDRGPIGANCLANPRDFKTPVASFEDRDAPCRLTVKWCGRFYVTELDHSPLDVVAWHGNYAPYKYDLAAFSPVGAPRRRQGLADGGIRLDDRIDDERVDEAVDGARERVDPAAAVEERARTRGLLVVTLSSGEHRRAAREGGEGEGVEMRRVRGQHAFDPLAGRAPARIVQIQLRQQQLRVGQLRVDFQRAGRRSRGGRWIVFGQRAREPGMRRGPFGILRERLLE
jgi:hypothetical protein